MAISEKVAKKKKRWKKHKMARGSRNLVFLGIISVVVAFVTTGVSLLIYHNSGDIYLDRSRPGFLPDEDEIGDEEEKTEEEYDFSKGGTLTKEGLRVYLDNLEAVVEAIDSYEKPFGAEVLSDEHLGIVEKVVPDGMNEKANEAVQEEVDE